MTTRLARLSLLLLVLLVPSVALSHTYWVPVVAHAGGVDSSLWRSDLGILNQCGTPATVELRLHAASGVVTTSCPGLRS